MQIYNHLFICRKRGKFIVPGLARFTVKSRPATKARQGINPFTKEPCVFKAKPVHCQYIYFACFSCIEIISYHIDVVCQARKIVRAAPVRAFKTVA